jgi:hypothetical protein
MQEEMSVLKVERTIAMGVEALAGVIIVRVSTLAGID